ncbi:M13 family metallopeptidase [Facklamia miroungae]|uniref:Putative endopeptidase n=1 Tax=Facklamia miroungae TaxID=120956 RepID=A0A1G7TVW2_9LACT|nr:M13 family metallopeptidase [Facklamia miroungae]NKZ29995.1 M13 family metallopeptidase [Facklamia miroungae]SDG39435.1 putative endopeptidase [Facklamia miroungae]
MRINQALLKDNLYQAVNGEWLEKAVIPSDKPATGGFMSLAEKVEEVCLNDISELLEDKITTTDPLMLEFIKLYKQALDFDQREKDGYVEAKAFLNSILSQADYQAITDKMVELLNYKLPSLINLSVEPDMKNAQQNSLYMDVPRLILPDTPYYDEENEKGQFLLDIYQKQSEELLISLDYDNEQSQQWVKNCIEFDRKLAKYQKTQEELADYTQNYNPRSIAEVKDYCQEIAIDSFIKQMIKEVPDKIIVTQPSFFENLNEIIQSDSIELLKSWLLVRTINDISGILSEDFRLKGSQFSLALSGTPEPMKAKKFNFYLVRDMFDQVIGTYYGKKYLGFEARNDIESMVKAMIEVYKNRLEKNQWLSDETIQLAIRKLEKFDYLIGFPDSYPEYYKDLKVNAESSLFKNCLYLKMIHQKNQFSEYGQTVDRDKWLMPADRVNAYYNPTLNNICFAAGILQAPFYSLDQSRAANYGGIGAVIAHEISHAFDNNGAKIDENGNLNNWWTDQDFEAFNQKAQAVVEQWEGMPFGQGKVNGKLTVSENIADGGGLTAALNALKNEGETDFKDFFINWARIWCQKARPDYELMLLQVDVHAPAELRGNVQVKNLDEFHETFGISEGDGMWLPPEDRVRIW